MPYIHRINEFDVENDFGYGPVTSVFFNFCPFHCLGCWNENTWSRDESLFISDSELVDSVIKGLDSFGMPKNLAILGGEPLHPCNIDSTLNLLLQVKEKRSDVLIGLWTGYRYEQLTNDNQIKCLNNIDYLIDGKYDLNKKTKNMRYGSYNQRVILSKKSSKNHIILEENYVKENQKNLKYGLKVNGYEFIDYM